MDEFSIAQTQSVDFELENNVTISCRRKENKLDWVAICNNVIDEDDILNLTEEHFQKGLTFHNCHISSEEFTNYISIAENDLRS